MLKPFRKIAKHLDKSSEMGQNKLLIFGLPTVILLIGAGLMIFAFLTGTFFQNVEYGDCQMEYGETVASWAGKGEEPWNQTGYRYQTKRFLIQAEALAVPFPNTAEKPPTYLISDDCQEELTSLVDTQNSDLRMQGARAEAVRLGLPAHVETGGKLLPEFEPRLASRVTPPVYGLYSPRAAAFVDDSGRATILDQSQERQAVAWCQTSFAIPADQTCQNVQLDTYSRNPAHSRGYLFTADNCPRELNCEQAGVWYQREGTLGALNYTEFIGQNQLGKLNPFYLRLEAASSYAPTAGVGMLMTFKYPTQPTLTVRVLSQSASLQVQEQYHPQLKLEKSGPNLTSTSVSLRGLFPLLGKEEITLDQEQLARLNREGTLSIPLDLLVSRSAFEGLCYQFQAVAEVESDQGTVKVIQTDAATSKYCIARPATTTHTYTVTTKGETGFDRDRFAKAVQQTLGDSRGWATSGKQFNRVGQHGDFAVVLATNEQTAQSHPSCSRGQHCIVGDQIIVNSKLWRQAPPGWRQKGGNQTDFRRFSINHYVGHWLGFAHRTCPGSNQQAPVMLLQATTDHDCQLNPWPTGAELQAVTNS